MGYKIEKLTIGYGRKVVIKNIDIELPERGLIYVAGENGSGKTTFIHTLAGKIKPLGGTFDKNLKNGLLLLQDCELFNGLNGSENVTLIARKQLGVEFIKKEAEKFGLAEILDRKVMSYSYGERMRLLFLAALLSDDAIIYCDEIDKGSDIRNLVQIEKSLKELAKTRLVIFTSHRNTLKTESDGIIIMQDGRFSFTAKTDIVSDAIAITPGPKFYNTKLILKALFRPFIVICLSFLTVVAATADIILFTGSYYKQVDIERETGYNYAYITGLFNQTLDDGDFNDPNVVPDYFSFTYTDKSFTPPVYVYNGNNYGTFSSTYLDYDLFEVPFALPETEAFTIYPNRSAVENFRRSYNFDSQKSDGCYFKFSRYDSYLKKEFNFSIPIQIGTTVSDVDVMKTSKVYYSGKKFKEAMNSYTVETGQATIPFLDYMADEELLSALGFRRYHLKADNSLIASFAEAAKEGKTFLSIDTYHYHFPIYSQYLSVYEGRQIDNSMFFILGWIGMGLIGAISIFTFLLIRRKTLNNFLLMSIFNYPSGKLAIYWLNVLASPVLAFIAVLITGLATKLIIYPIILLSLMIIIVMAVSLVDSKKAVRLLSSNAGESDN